MMEGLGVIGVLLGVVPGLVAFIALMCIWANTGKTAALLEKQWKLECAIRDRDPESGRSWAEIRAEKDAIARAKVQQLAEKAARKAGKR